MATDRQTSFVAIFGDDADARWFDGGADEQVDVVVAEFAHQPHLFHGLSADLAPFRKAQVFDSHDRSPVAGYVGEHLIHCYARQTQL